MVARGAISRPLNLRIIRHGLLLLPPGRFRLAVHPEQNVEDPKQGDVWRHRGFLAELVEEADSPRGFAQEATNDQPMVERAVDVVTSPTPNRSVRPFPARGVCSTSQSSQAAE